MNNGAALTLLSEKISATIARANSSQLSEHSLALKKRWDRLLQTTKILHATNDLNLTLANAAVYLEAFGHLVISWIWLEQAIAAHTPKHNDVAFYSGKRQACDWFFRCELPRVDAQLDLLESLDATSLAMQDDWF